jgi:hypothetical protein
MRLYLWLSGCKFSEVERLNDSVNALLARGYFSPMWIVQGLSSRASTVTLCCDNTTISFLAVFALYRLIDYFSLQALHFWDLRHYPGDHHRSNLRLPTLLGRWFQKKLVAMDPAPFYRSHEQGMAHDLMHISVDPSSILPPGIYEEDRPAFRWEEALQVATAFICSDPGDRICSMREFVPNSMQLSVDYTISAYDLGIRAMVAATNSFKGASVAGTKILAQAFAPSSVQMSSTLGLSQGLPNCQPARSRALSKASRKIKAL